MRYMDDFVVWGDDRAGLSVVRERIGEFLARELSLGLKPDPYINRSRFGMDFLGCRVKPEPHGVESAKPGSLRATIALAGTRARGRSARRGGTAAACHGPGRLHPSGPDGELALAEPGLYNRSRWTAMASSRVIRGGSWNNNPRNCRPANRNRNTPENRNNNLGFRVAAALPARWIPRRTGPAARLTRSRRLSGRANDDSSRPVLVAIAKARGGPFAPDGLFPVVNIRSNNEDARSRQSGRPADGDRIPSLFRCSGAE